MFRKLLFVIVAVVAVEVKPQGNCWAQVPATVVNPHPRINTLIVDIEEGRSADAQYSARWHSDVASRAVLERWRQLRAEHLKSGDDMAAKRKRFVLLDFYFRYCREPSTETDVKEDFLRLVADLKTAPSDLPATEETLELLNRCSRAALYKNTSRELVKLGEDLLACVAKRPNDGAVWESIYNVTSAMRDRGMGDFRSPELVFDFKRLIGSATTSYSKVKLVNILRYARIPEDIRKPALAGALPHLSCDEERATLCFNQLELDGSGTAQIILANKIIADYPTTDIAKVACARKVGAIARTEGAEKALQALEADRPKLELSPDQIRNSQLIIADSLNQPEVARELLVGYANQWEGTTHQTQAVERLFNLAWKKRSAKEVEYWANKGLSLLKPSEQLVGNDFAPQLGRFYMAQKRWEEARKVWNLWQPDNYGCGSWDVMPHETQKIQSHLCLLFQNRHREAVESMKASLDGRAVPALLFYMYDRAGQIEDLKQIVARYLSDSDAKRQSSFCMSFDARQSIPELRRLHLPQEENWLIPQLLRLREIAKEKDAETLCLFLISDYTQPAFIPPTDIATRDTPLHCSIWAEACRLLADMGEESLSAIEKACSELEPKRNGGSKDWLVRSLLANRSPKAQQLLLKIIHQPKLNISGLDEAGVHIAIAKAARDGVPQGSGMGMGAAEATPPCVRFYLENQPVPLTFAWPAPPNGSLPKATELFP